MLYNVDLLSSKMYISTYIKITLINMMFIRDILSILITIYDMY